MNYLGDFPASHTAVCIPFDSFAAATGAPSAVTNFAAGDVLVYKDGGTTQRSSSAGITVSTSFDSQTGLQMIVIDLSDNTDSGFYAAGHEYQVGVADITIDGQTVRFWAGTFSIERAGGILALLKGGTSGLAALKTLIDTLDDFVDTEVGAIKTQTDKLTFTVANQIDANVLDWKSATAPAMTGDAFARLGAPAGASVSADVLAVKTDTADVKLKTDKLRGVTPTYGEVVSDAGNSSSTFKTDLSETETDHWKDSFLTFLTGDLSGQTRQISAYNGASKFITAAAYSDEPAAGDEFVLVND